MIKHIFIILSIITFLSPKSPDNKWKLVKDKNGIKVYTYIPENSDLKEIRMESYTEAELSQAAAVLMDVESYSEWIYKCSHAKIVKRIKENEIIYYSITTAPWPILDRDLVVNNKIYQNSKGVVFSQSDSKPKLLPAIAGRVRITDLFGLWKFTSLENGKIKIEYYIKVDPAGKLPAWVINMFITNGPYQTMVKFKEQLQKEKYKQTKIDFINN